MTEAAVPTLTVRERLTRAIRRLPVDRTPVTLYEFHRFGGCWAAEEPSYRPLLDLQERLGDPFVFAPVGGELMGDPHSIRRHSALAAAKGQEITTTIQTPRGPLVSVSRRDPGIATTWVLRHYVENEEEARRFLSLPMEYTPPNQEELTSLASRVGEQGLLNFSIGDPLGHIAGLWKFEELVMACYHDPGLIRAMLDHAAEYLRHTVGFINERFSGICFRFWGPEYCGAPLMDPRRFFRSLVVDYVSPLVKLVHDGGNFAILHCHGRLDTILEMIIETGADMLEPLETLPATTADVSIDEVARRVDGRMCLAGGIQALDLDSGTPAPVRERARQVIQAVGSRGLILLPTSTPLQIPLPPHIVENYRGLFETAHAHYGA
jgi:hypothetical protein